MRARNWRCPGIHPPTTAARPVTGYKVQWKEAADRWDIPADVSEETVTGTSHIIDGLTDGVEYAVKVMASNEAGNSDPSDEETGTPRETTPPELSTATVNGTTLMLAYDEDLAADSNPAAAAFSVAVGGTGRIVDRVSVEGNSVTLTLASPATAGDTVTVSYTAPTGDSAARIRDLAGNDAASFENEAVTNNTEESREPPSVPQNLRAVENADGSVTLTWDAPDDDSITGYQILRRQSNAGEKALRVYQENTGNTATTYTDSAVSPGGRYIYRVKAITSSVWAEVAPCRNYHKQLGRFAPH